MNLACTFAALACLIPVGASAVPPAATGMPASPLAPAVVETATPQLAERWWQWAMAAPEGTGPVADRTGAQCTWGQKGDTWFLAGGFGTSLIRRTCTVPAGKKLFFPVINMVYYPLRDATTFTCDRAKALARLNNEVAIDLFAELDGAVVPDVGKHRVASVKCFDIFARVPAADDPYKAFPSATDGYWLLLKPLPPGRHVLKFGGRYNRNSPEYGRMVQDIEYVLTVQ